jgi:hypothetical protein
MLEIVTKRERQLVQEKQTDEEKQVRHRRAPNHQVLGDMAEQPQQQRMQREESKLPATVVLDVEWLAQVTFAREDHVVGHVGAPHRLAQLARDLNVLQPYKCVPYVDRGRSRLGMNDEVAHRDEDDEDQAAGQDENEKRVAQALALPEANDPLVVEQFSEFWQQVVRTRI